MYPVYCLSTLRRSGVGATWFLREDPLITLGARPLMGGRDITGMACIGGRGAL